MYNHWFCCQALQLVPQPGSRQLAGHQRLVLNFDLSVVDCRQYAPWRGAYGMPVWLVLAVGR